MENKKVKKLPKDQYPLKLAPALMKRARDAAKKNSPSFNNWIERAIETELSDIDKCKELSLQIKAIKNILKVD